MPSIGTPPSKEPRRPAIRCRRPPQQDGEPLPVPPPGTILETADGTTIVYVGDDDRSDQQQIRDLSVRLRSASSIVLVGLAARHAKVVLGNAWTETTRARQQAAKAVPPPKTPVQRCGQPARTGGACGLAAGWGTDTPGTGPCFHHGGSTELQDQVLREAEQQAKVFAKLHAKSRKRPLTVREQLEGQRGAARRAAGHPAQAPPTTPRLSRSPSTRRLVAQK